MEALDDLVAHNFENGIPYEEAMKIINNIVNIFRKERSL